MGTWAQKVSQIRVIRIEESRGIISHGRTLQVTVLKAFVGSGKKEWCNRFTHHRRTLQVTVLKVLVGSGRRSSVIDSLTTDVLLGCERLAQKSVKIEEPREVVFHQCLGVTDPRVQNLPLVTTYVGNG